MRTSRWCITPTQIIEGVQGRTDLLTDFGLWVDVLKSVDQRGIFGTQFFPIRTFC